MSSTTPAPRHLPPWLRGPVAGVPRELEAVAHALQQTLEEVEDFTRDFPDELLSYRPAGLGHTAFHLKHIAGVIDRLLTIASGESITDEQRQQALDESQHDPSESVSQLVANVRQVIERGIEQLRHTDLASLYEPRLVGRKQLPSTVFGTLFHAAEHSQRHCGQLLVTTRVALEQAKKAG